MNKLAKVIRTITVAPISAVLISVFIYFFLPEAFNNISELFIAIFALGFLPIISYPIQRRFHLIKGEPRDAERKLAFVFCIAGYIIGALISICFNIPVLQKLLYMTYFFSGVIMILFNFVLKIRASGHMCGVSGPIAVAIYLFGWQHILLFIILLGLVWWSSIRLKRHEKRELIVGFLIPIISMLISIVIIIY